MPSLIMTNGHLTKTTSDSYYKTTVTVDNSPVIQDVFINGAWRTVLLGSLSPRRPRHLRARRDASGPDDRVQHPGQGALGDRQHADALRRSRLFVFVSEHRAPQHGPMGRAAVVELLSAAEPDAGRPGERRSGRESHVALRDRSCDGRLDQADRDQLGPGGCAVEDLRPLDRCRVRPQLQLRRRHRGRRRPLGQPLALRPDRLRDGRRIAESAVGDDDLRRRIRRDPGQLEGRFPLQDLRIERRRHRPDADLDHAGRHARSRRGRADVGVRHRQVPRPVRPYDVDAARRLRRGCEHGNAIDLRHTRLRQRHRSDGSRCHLSVQCRGSSIRGRSRKTAPACAR